VNSTGWLIAAATAYVVILCAGGFFYDRHRVNRRPARNEVIHEENTDQQVSVKEEISI